MARKVLAAFTLILLLAQWSAPVICMPQSMPMGSCHEATAADMAIMSAAQNHVPCAEVGMCALQVTAVASLAAPLIPVPRAQDAFALSAASLVPSDPSTPPAPPPQA